MEGEATAVETTEPIEGAQETPVTPPAQTADARLQESARTFNQEDVDRIVKERIERERKKAQADAAKAQEAAALKAAEEQGEYKKLYEQMSQKMAEAQRRAEELERQQLQAKVAQTVGIPPALATRLIGATEEELTADAKALLASLPKPQAPNINASPGAGATPRTDLGMPVEEFAAIYGVNPQFIK